MIFELSGEDAAYLTAYVRKIEEYNAKAKAALSKTGTTKFVESGLHLDNDVTRARKEFLNIAKIATEAAEALVTIRDNEYERKLKIAEMS